MNTDNELLLKNLQDLVQDTLKQAKHLQNSYKRCSNIDINDSLDSLDEDTLESLEALVSRFGRLSDMLIQKVFRSLDEVELMRSGTIIDLINGAEKRSIIDSADDFKEIRKTRNSIEHEYMTSGLTDLYFKTLQYTPALLSACEKLEAYVKNIKNKI